MAYSIPGSQHDLDDRRTPPGDGHCASFPLILPMHTSQVAFAPGGELLPMIELIVFPIIAAVFLLSVLALTVRLILAIINIIRERIRGRRADRQIAEWEARDQEGWEHFLKVLNSDSPTQRLTRE